MIRGLTGNILQVSAFGGEKVSVFIPFPLPPKPPIEFSAERQQLLEKAILALGRLDSVSLLLPNPDIFIYSYVRREAVLSSHIEGTQSSLSDLLLFELKEVPGVPLDDVQEVSNYVCALNYGIKRLNEGFPLSNRLVREMHEKLLSSGRGSEKFPGEFRTTQNWIGGTRPGNAYFVPPPPYEVENCMSELERFLHNKNVPYPAIIKAALAHAQFETIHPFLDGNGRIGRLLIAFILYNEKVLSKPLLYLSLYFKINRSEYYDLLNRVRFQGDWEAWIDFFLEGVQQTATSAVDTTKRLVDLFSNDEKKLQGLGRITPTVIRIFHCLCQHPLTTINNLCQISGLSFPSVAKAMKALIQKGIARETTGQQRNQIFVYDKYLAILNEEMEPIH